VGTLGLTLDDRAKLTLRANEKDPIAARNDIADQALRELDLTSRLLEVDDVDAVTLREDELPHLRVPTAGLVAEMYAGLQELLDLVCCCHAYAPNSGGSTPAFFRPAYHKSGTRGRVERCGSSGSDKSLPGYQLSAIGYQSPAGPIGDLSR